MADPLRFPVTPRPVRQLMPSLSTSADGMSIQQRFLEVIARNIANAETTHTPEGGSYVRQIAVAGGGGTDGEPSTDISKDTSVGRLVYDPGHPDANEEGFVRFPNVDVQTEIVDLMIVRRLYEANATVFQAAKQMLKRALEI